MKCENREALSGQKVSLETRKISAKDEKDLGVKRPAFGVAFEGFSGVLLTYFFRPKSRAKRPN
jgi:hypothetical protein